MKVTVKLDERSDRGFMRGPLRAEIRVDGKRIGSISAGHHGWGFSLSSDRHNLAFHNSHEKPLGSYAEAKAAAIAYVKQHAEITTKYRFEIPVTGVLSVENYAMTDHEARTKAMQSAASVIASLPTAILWGEPGEPRRRPNNEGPK